MQNVLLIAVHGNGNGNGNSTISTRRRLENVWKWADELKDATKCTGGREKGALKTAIGRSALGEAEALKHKGGSHHL